jgi:dTDP-4-dehydrorhamnose reductase
MKLKIAATGLGGLIGSRIEYLLKNDIDFVNIRSQDVDITNRDAVTSYINQLDVDMVLHLAAMTDVDGCEVRKDDAWKINVEGTRNVFDAAQAKNIPFIYVSTGFVFDGEHPPYVEDSIPHPISYYATTKYEAEKIVSGKGMIIRIDYPYGHRTAEKNDFVHTLINMLRERKPIKGIVDQIFTPTYIDDIAAAISYLAYNFTPSVYHIVGSDSLSGIDAITLIGEVFEIDTDWVDTTTYKEFYKDKAARPRNNIMKSTRNNFVEMKSFREGLEDLKIIGL